MDIVIEPTSADNVAVTVKLCMTIGEWKRLRDQITTDYPGWRVRNAIDAVVRKFTERIESSLQVGP